MKEEREELIGKIRAMRDKGMKISEISRATGLSRPTIRHYLKLSLDSDSDSDKEDRFLEKPKTLIGSIRRAIPVPDPSSDLKIQREETEKTFLEVERARALKSLERLTQEVPEEIKRKENELEIKK
jgi:orotate phosphoribosyltransferase-like protein